MKRVLAALAAGLLTSACASTFKEPTINTSTMRYDKVEAVKPEELKVAKDFQVDNAKQVLFLRTNIDTEEQYTRFFKQSIEKYGYFGEVLRKDEFERFLISKNLQDQIGDVGGFASLSKAAGVIGDFMFADISLAASPGYQVKATFTVYNARDASEQFKVERQVTNWSGLD